MKSRSIKTQKRTRQISSHLLNFRFVTKLQQNSALCSREISLKKPRIFTRTCARTFEESSREQRTKFAHFTWQLHYFCTILYLALKIILAMFCLHTYLLINSLGHGSGLLLEPGVLDLRPLDGLE